MRGTTESYLSLKELISCRRAEENLDPSLLKTSWTFQDIDRKDLLSYAIELAINEKNFTKIDEVLDLLEHDEAVKPDELKSSLTQALQKGIQSGNLKLIQKIQNSSVRGIQIDPIDLHLEPKLPREIKRYLIGEIKKSLYSISKEPLSAGEQAKKLEKQCIQAVEIGALSFLKAHLKFANLDDLLDTSIKNDKYKIFHYLLTRNKISLFGKGVLHKAIIHDAQKILKYLQKLPEIDILINEHWEEGSTPLMFAIIEKNFPLIDYLLKNKQINLKLSSMNGNTLLHLAAKTCNPEIIQKISQAISDKLGKEALMEIACQKNIYGKTLLDIKEVRQHEIFSTLQSTFSYLIPQEIELIPISQSLINRKIEYFLRLNRRNLEFFSSEGFCNGYDFLFFLNSHQKQKAYFFETLAALGSWEGASDFSKQELFDNLKKMWEKINQKDYPYTTWDDLFDGWINDLTWFQHTQAQRILRCSTQQYERKRQLELVEEKIRINDDYISGNQELSLAQILELVTYLSKLPEGTAIEINGNYKEDAHIVALRVEKNNQLSFYDSSSPYQLDANLSLSQIANLLFFTLGENGQKPWINYQIYSFDYKEKEAIIDLENFEQLIGKIPSKEEVTEFQKQSLNQFTPLHLAVISNNLTAIQQLLDLGHDDQLLDAQGKSALDIAMQGNSRAAFILLKTKSKEEMSFLLKKLCNAQEDTFFNKLAREKALDILSYFFRLWDPKEIKSLILPNADDEFFYDILFNELPLKQLIPMFKEFPYLFKSILTTSYNDNNDSLLHLLAREGEFEAIDALIDTIKKTDFLYNVVNQDNETVYDILLKHPACNELLSIFSKPQYLPPDFDLCAMLKATPVHERLNLLGHEHMKKFLFQSLINCKQLSEIAYLLPQTDHMAFFLMENNGKAIIDLLDVHDENLADLVKFFINPKDSKDKLNLLTHQSISKQKRWRQEVKEIKGASLWKRLSDSNQFAILFEIIQSMGEEAFDLLMKKNVKQETIFHLIVKNTAFPDNFNNLKLFLSLLSFENKRMILLMEDKEKVSLIERLLQSILPEYYASNREVIDSIFNQLNVEDRLRLRISFFKKYNQHENLRQLVDFIFSMHELNEVSVELLIGLTDNPDLKRQISLFTKQVAALKSTAMHVSEDKAEKLERTRALELAQRIETFVHRYLLGQIEGNISLMDNAKFSLSQQREEILQFDRGVTKRLLNATMFSALNLMNIPLATYLYGSKPFGSAATSLTDEEYSLHY